MLCLREMSRAVQRTGDASTHNDMIYMMFGRGGVCLSQLDIAQARDCLGCLHVALAGSERDRHLPNLYLMSVILGAEIAWVFMHIGSPCRDMVPK
jgi:hypothetical protein